MFALLAIAALGIAGIILVNRRPGWPPSVCFGAGLCVSSIILISAWGLDQLVLR